MHVVSFPSSLVGFLGFHPYMHLFSFRKLFCDLLDCDHRSGCAQLFMHVYSAKCIGQCLQLPPQQFYTIPTSCAILPPLTKICFAFLIVVCRGLWKAVWWVVLGVHVDVHGEWVMLWVAAMYNVLALLSMADVVCMQKLLSP